MESPNVELTQDIHHETVEVHLFGFDPTMGVIHKPRGQLRVRGVSQMTIL